MSPLQFCISRVDDFVWHCSVSFPSSASSQRLCVMSADGKPDGTDLFKSEGFWRIAGTAVFLRHVLLLQPEGPFEFKVEDLCFWLAQLLRSAENEIAEELDAHQVLLSSQPADDVATWLLCQSTTYYIIES